jgi:hypothetical protein
MSGQPSNVIPLPPRRHEKGFCDAPGAVLSLRGRLFERVLEEAWAERENHRAAMDLPPRLRLRVVR